MRADASSRLAALAAELRPRLVLLRLRAGPVRLAWAAPLGAFEEIVAFALRCAPLLTLVRRRGAVAPAPTQLGAAVDALFALPDPGLLRLPPGESWLRVDAGEVRLELTQL